MSGGAGVPDIPALDASGLRLAIVASTWHTQICDALLAGAQSGRRVGRRRPDGGPGARRDRDSGRRAGPGPQPRRRRRAGRGNPRGDTAFRLCLRRGDPGPDPGFARRVHAGRQRRADHNTEEQALDRAGLPDSAEDKGAQATAAAPEHRADPARSARSKS